MQSKVFLSLIVLLAISACDSDSQSDSTVADNCPGIDNPDQLDFDADGTGDVCDDDDDGDGFNDDDDIAPLDPTRPGDFSSPEAILTQPAVVQALSDLADRGFTLNTSLDTSPPDTSGLYRREDLTGLVLDTSTGQNVGGTFFGSESRRLVEDGRISSASVFFNENQPVGFSVGSGAFIRGAGNSFSTYSTRSAACTIGGADFMYSTIGIASAEYDPTTGNIINSRSIDLTVDTSGELNNECRSAVNARVAVGGWVLFEYTQIPSVTIDSIQYMCVNGTDAYAPTESWITADGESCECSENYETVCGL